MKPKLKTEVETFIEKHHPCAEGATWARQYRTMAQVWKYCTNVEWMLWITDKHGCGADRLLRLFGCWCVRNTPLADGRKVWDLLTDPRSRAAVEVAERFAYGKATVKELAVARAVAWAVAKDAARDAARAAARTAADAARAAARTAADAAAAAQCDGLRLIFGNPFKKAKKTT